MKPSKSLLCGALALSFSLAACGSSVTIDDAINDPIGGGGGGSTFTTGGMSTGANSRTAPNAMSDANEVAAALATDATMQAALKSGYAMTSDGGIYKLKAESDGSMTIRNATDVILTSFGPSEMKFYEKEGVKFATLIDAPKSASVPRFTGSAQQKDVVWIGNLAYASFGYWLSVVEKHGTEQGETVNEVALLDGATFYEGKKADYSAGNLSFKGVAAGMVQTWGNDINSAVTPITGTAELDIHGASNGTLKLEFANFLRLTGAVNTAANGALTGSFNSIEKLGTAVPLPITLPPTGSGLSKNNIAGQLYGDSAINPTEAAGTWGIEHNVSGVGAYIGGGWGVKKP
jgi:hypothetical protein